MANLADIEVELTLDMSGFNNDLSSAQKEINKASRNISRQANGMNREFNKSFGDITKGLGGMGGHFNNFASRASRALELTEDDLKGLPDHFKPMAFEANSVSKSVSKSVGHMSKVIEQVAYDTQYATVKFNDFGKAGSSTKKPLATLNEVREKADKAKFAMIGLSENGKVRISAEEANKRIHDFNKSVSEARKEMEKLNIHGGAETAQEGLRQLQEASNDVNRTFKAVGQGGRGLSNVFRQMGVISQDSSDATVLAMERMKTHVLRANDLLMEKSTQSQGVMKLTDGITYYGVSRQLLKLGHNLEQRAKDGTALNLALKRVGKDAPFAKIADETKKIQAGIGRLPVLTMGMGVAVGAVTYGLITLSNEIDGRLKPAFEELKGTWADALKPFVSAFTTALVKVIEFGTWIGKLAKKFAEVHPQLSQMTWGFAYLTLVFTLLLAPLAVGIGLTGGLAAGFTLLWAAIAPFVIGFLTVVGVAMLVAAAIVIVVAVINNMWKASGNFRKAITDTWNGIKQAVVNAIQPLKDKWEELKSSFDALIEKLTGGKAKSMGDFWKWLGDKMAEGINVISTILAPLLTAALDLIVMAFGWVIDVIKFVVDAFTVALPFIIPIVKSTWDSVVNLIKGAVDVITGVIDFFKALFTGDWKGMWAAVKQIVKGALAVVWNYFLLFMGGKILGFVGKFAKGLISKVVGGFSKMKSGATTWIKNLWKSVSDWFGKMKTSAGDKVSGMARAVQGYFVGLKNKAGSIVSGLYNAVVKKFSSMKTSAGDKARALKDAVAGWFLKMKTKLAETVHNASKAVVDKFSSMKTSAVNKASDILSGVSSKFSSLKDKIVNPITSAKDKVMGIIDKIRSAFSNMKISLPKISLPTISLGKKSIKVMGKEISVPTFGIHWNAKGGIFNGASLLGGGQGVGEAGAEAVLPIQHRRYMAPFANAVAAQLDKVGNGSNQPSHVTYQINMNDAVIREEADIQRIVDEMERRRKIQERSRGVVSFG